MRKKLLINCAVCDTRKIEEENYAHYEAITINSSIVLTSAGAKAVMSRLPFTLNCANVIESEETIDFRTVNGSGEIKSSDEVPKGRFYMLVNGVLTVGPGTQKQLAQCAGMIVNGSLLCPESLYASLPGLNVNGSVICYPDEAILLKGNAVIDRLFALRARNSLYWSDRRIIMVDRELDPEILRGKGASFCAAEIIIARSKAEGLIDLIDEKSEIIIVPDDTAVVTDDIILNKAALRRYGKRLYAVGDVTVPENADVLDQLEYLNIRGDVLVPQQHEEKLLETAAGLGGEVKIVKPKGAVLEDKPFVKITRWMLERQTAGIDVSDCGIVKIADDISKDLIADRLRIENCGIVKCSEEQEDAVTMICEDVMQIDTAANSSGEDGGVGSTIAGALGALKDTKVINAAEYVL